MAHPSAHTLLLVLALAYFFCSSQVIHVLDASKAVTVVSTLMDPAEKDDFCADIKEEYVVVASSCACSRRHFIYYQ